MTDLLPRRNVLAGGVLTAASAFASQIAFADDQQARHVKELQGKWNYQSFCSFAAVADRSAASPATPKEMRPALIAGPWTPPAIMEFVTDSAGKVTGSAKLGPLEFTIVGSITPAVEGIAERAANSLPEGVELVVAVRSTGSVYNIRGYFLAGSTHIVGTVVAISNDLGLQPAGTSGPFVLYPVNP